MAQAIHINAPAPTKRALQSSHCPDCGRRSWFVRHFYEYYGWHDTCLRCGREWSGGEWLPLPFARGIRRRNIADAKRRWRAETAAIRGRKG